MMYLVDTVVVETGRADEYLEVLRQRVVPTMTEAGAALAYCRSTSADVGQPVEIQLAWTFADNVAWNEIRRNLVLDPRYYAYAALLAPLRRSGTRRFYRSLPSIEGDQR